MVYEYMEKAVYIRETRNGKTKWVKLPDVTAQVSSRPSGKERLITRLYVYLRGPWTEFKTWDDNVTALELKRA